MPLTVAQRQLFGVTLRLFGLVAENVFLTTEHTESTEKTISASQGQPKATVLFDFSLGALGVLGGSICRFMHFGSAQIYNSYKLRYCGAVKKYVVLGIDPGTRITGYGIIREENSRHEPIDFGCIRPPPHLALPKRYAFLFSGIKELIVAHRPDAVAVESQFVYKNPKSAMMIGMARAMALLAAAQEDIPIYEYTPRTAKQAVVGNGAASKEQVQKMIQLLLRLPAPPEPEDAADALALAICHTHRRRSHV
jgi:crossover junction endodeoxyribonuclease RuvC